MPWGRCRENRPGEEDEHGYVKSREYAKYFRYCTVYLAIAFSSILDFLVVNTMQPHSHRWFRAAHAILSHHVKNLNDSEITTTIHTLRNRPSVSADSQY